MVQIHTEAIGKRTNCFVFAPKQSSYPNLKPILGIPRFSKSTLIACNLLSLHAYFASSLAKTITNIGKSPLSLSGLIIVVGAISPISHRERQCSDEGLQLSGFLSNSRLRNLASAGPYRFLLETNSPVFALLHQNQRLDRLLSGTNLTEITYSAQTNT